MKSMKLMLVAGLIGMSCAINMVASENNAANGVNTDINGFSTAIKQLNSNINWLDAYKTGALAAAAFGASRCFNKIASYDEIDQPSHWDRINKFRKSYKALRYQKNCYYSILQPSVEAPKTFSDKADYFLERINARNGARASLIGAGVFGALACYKAVQAYQFDRNNK